MTLLLVRRLRFGLDSAFKDLSAKFACATVSIVVFVPEVFYVGALEGEFLLALWTYVGERVIGPAWDCLEQGLTLSGHFPFISMLGSSSLIHDPLAKFFFFYI